MAEKKRIAWIDQLRGLAFYLVVLGHAGVGGVLKNWLYSFHMPLFFIISGLNLNIEKIYNTPFKDYALRLAKRMLVPYLWLQMFGLLIKFSAYFAAKGKFLDLSELLVGIFVGTSRIINAPSNAMYFLLLLYLAQLGIWAVTRITKGNKVYMSGIFFVLSLISICTPMKDALWHLNVVPVAMLLIFTGRLLMDLYVEYEEKISRIKTPYYSVLCVALFAFGALLMLYNGRASIHANVYGNDFVVYFISALCSSIAFSLVVIRLPEMKLFSYIGMNTLFILGVHEPAIYWFKVFCAEHWSKLWLSLLISVICYFGLVPFAYLFSKAAPYTCGNPLKEENLLVKVFRYVVVALSGFMPYFVIVSKICGSTVPQSIFGKLAAVAVFAVLVIAGEKVCDMLLPELFGKQRKKKQSLAGLQD